jgi:hydrogenase maturation protease
MNTLIMGMGNTIITDDGVGIRVAEQLKKELTGHQDITVTGTSLSGLSLLDVVAGYERVVVVDSVQTQGGKPGAIYRMTPSDLDKARNSTTLHDINLLTALELGQKLEMDMPREVIIFSIEARDMVTFSEKCTPEVEKAIPIVVDLILEAVAPDAATHTQTG